MRNSFSWCFLTTDFTAFWFFTTNIVLTKMAQFEKKNKISTIDFYGLHAYKLFETFLSFFY